MFKKLYILIVLAISTFMLSPYAFCGDSIYDSAGGYEGYTMDYGDGQENIYDSTGGYEGYILDDGSGQKSLYDSAGKYNGYLTDNY